MALVTFQVLNGQERGTVHADLPTPVTIGREEENSIQLNDEGISRFHAKVQEDHGRVILTDLESTNGTRVNGHIVQIRVLQIGDQVAIGHSLLIYGSDEEIALQRNQQQTQNHGSLSSDSPTIALAGKQLPDVDSSDDLVGDLFPGGPPEIPVDLRPVHTAQVSDILAYLHQQIEAVLDEAEEQKSEDDAYMRVQRSVWQQLLKIEMDLARYLRRLADPRG